MSPPKSVVARPVLTLSERIVEALCTQYDEGLLTMDGFDECIVGVVTRVGELPIVCYDRRRVIARLAQDMSPEDAEEYFSFNLEGWMGPRTPCFIELLELGQG